MDDFAAKHVSQDDEAVGFLFQVIQVLFQSGIDKFENSLLIHASADSPPHFTSFSLLLW